VAITVSVAGVLAEKLICNQVARAGKNHRRVSDGPAIYLPFKRAHRSKLRARASKPSAIELSLSEVT
jgi:hypothetical protein